jgi:hypothetical protein
VPISSRARVLDYLGSTPNLLGSGLGLAALFVVAITGLAGAQWPALVILVYVAGVAIGKAHLHRRGCGRASAACCETTSGRQVGATIPQKLTPVTLSWHVRGVSGERVSVIAGYPRGR